MADETFMGEEKCGNCKHYHNKSCNLAEIIEETSPCFFDPSRFEPAHGKSLGSDKNAKDLEEQND